MEGKLEDYQEQQKEIKIAKCILTKTEPT